MHKCPTVCPQFRVEFVGGSGKSQTLKGTKCQHGIFLDFLFSSPTLKPKPYHQRISQKCPWGLSQPKFKVQFCTRDSYLSSMSIKFRCTTTLTSLWEIGVVNVKLIHTLQVTLVPFSSTLNVSWNVSRMRLCPKRGTTQSPTGQLHRPRCWIWTTIFVTKSRDTLKVIA